MSSFSKAELDNLYSDKKMFGDMSLKASENLANVSFIKKFFNDWASKGSNQAGYLFAVSNLPKDKPTTSQNEEITEDSFKKRAEDFFGKSWSQILAENKSTADIQKHINELYGKIRLYVYQQQALHNEEEETQRRIDNANARQKESFLTPDEG